MTNPNCRIEPDTYCMVPPCSMHAVLPPIGLPELHWSGTGLLSRYLLTILITLFGFPSAPSFPSPSPQISSSPTFTLFLLTPGWLLLNPYLVASASVNDHQKPSPHQNTFDIFHPAEAPITPLSVAIKSGSFSHCCFIVVFSTTTSLCKDKCIFSLKSAL